MNHQEHLPEWPVIIDSFPVDGDLEQAAKNHIKEFDLQQPQRRVRPRKGFSEVSILPPNFLAKHVALTVANDDPSRLKYNPDGSITILNNPREI
jgi:hypothetical protein